MSKRKFEIHVADRSELSVASKMIENGMSPIIYKLSENDRKPIIDVSSKFIKDYSTLNVLPF